MKTRSLLRLTQILPVIFATACIEEIDSPDESQLEADLSTADWGPTVGQAGTSYGAQVATVNGTTYMVHSDVGTHAMYWKKRTGWQQWTTGQLIPGQKTSDQPSLASFNGFLYMLHVGETDTSAVWYSRFDPITETWTENKKLALSTSIGAPAIAGFDGRLWIVGATELDDYRNQIWVATMTPDGTVGGPLNVRFRTTGHRPSLAVFAGKLFMSFDNNNSNYTITHTAGSLATSWSNPSPVSSGPQGTPASGWDARLAVAGGYLHLVHTLAGNRPLDTYWTYWNQCKWAPEVRLPEGRTNRPPSLTDGGTGLIMTREPLQQTGYDWYRVDVTEYTAPPPPITVPQCGGAVGSI